VPGFAKDGGKNVKLKDGKEKNIIPVSNAGYNPCGWRAWLNNTTITLGLQNVFDQDPPVVAGSFENGYDESLATIKGRFLVRSVEKEILNADVIRWFELASTISSDAQRIRGSRDWRSPQHTRERPEADANGSERIKSLAVSLKNRDVSTPLDMTKTKKAYARAGVDVDLANRLKRGIGAFVRQTHRRQVVGKIGGFGGLFRATFPGMRDPVLVASVDGVGTKVKIAFALNKHDTIGADLVNHCVDDIAVLGARPLFFLDYIGCEKLDPRVFDQLLRGLARACRAAKCALIGGETAQLGDMYRKGEYDLAGCIVGVVDRTKIIDGRKIKPGDVVLGLASNGLHTNGYSLARKILFQKMRLKPSSPLPGSTITVGEELLRVHKNYQPLLAKVPSGVTKGFAHITGGGLIDNLPRILPSNCDAVIETKSWRVPSIFQILQKNGSVDAQEMYQVFNMGIGMVAIVAEQNARSAVSILRAQRIGRIEPGSGTTVLKF